MNDKTIIRPGGRRPRPGQGNDDQTVVRGSNPPQQGAPQQGGFQQDASDRTVVRPRGQSGQAPAQSQPPTQPSQQQTAQRYRDPSFSDTPQQAGPASAQRYVAPDYQQQQAPQTPPQQQYQQPQQQYQAPQQTAQQYQQPAQQHQAPQSPSYQPQQQMPPQVPQQTAPVAPNIQQPAAQVSNNPLLDLVSPLLSIAGKIRASGGSLDLEEFKHHAIQQIQHFQSCQFCLQGDQDLQFKASYGLCCLVDDLVLNTPWSKNSSWINESLLSVFHQETWGGEKFFAFLQEMESNPAATLNVLELYYLAMELGFEGKYREIPNGQPQHQNVKQNTFLLLSRYKPPQVEALSSHWKGIPDDKNSLVRLIPQWVIWSVTAGLSLVVFIVLSFMLAQLGDPVNQRVVSKYKEAPIQVIHQNRLPVTNTFEEIEQPDLEEIEIDYIEYFRGAFAREMDEGLMAVNVTDFGALVRLSRGDLFRSGSATLSEDYIPLVKKIGSVLSELDVRINVVGHTDNVPIRTLKFASNYALSGARARTVMDLLSDEVMSASRLSAEGLADTNPVAPNDTESNRALNRRVDIELHQ